MSGADQEMRTCGRPSFGTGPAVYHGSIPNLTEYATSINQTSISHFTFRYVKLCYKNRLGDGMTPIQIIQKGRSTCVHLSANVFKPHFFARLDFYPSSLQQTPSLSQCQGLIAGRCLLASPRSPCLPRGAVAVVVRELGQDQSQGTEAMAGFLRPSCRPSREISGPWWSAPVGALAREEPPPA